MTQNEALTILKTGANVFLTGEPGSGKSHTVNEYVAYLRDAGIEPAITASTGIAATHIGGMTIHGWSGIGIKKHLSPYDVDAIASNPYVYKRIERTRVLIIDEVSMLDAATLDAVDAVCREVKRRPEAFGGMQVIFVGDFFQLPPVAKDETPTFAFRSLAWGRARPLVAYLSEQHRQDDDAYLELLAAMRRGEVREEHRMLLVSRSADMDDAIEHATRLYSHNENVDELNHHALRMIEDDERTYLMTSSGSDALVTSLKRSCLSPEVLGLKLGAEVMFTKNNPEERFANGTLGVVIGFDEETTYPTIRTKDGRDIFATPMEWVVEENGKVKARIGQLPLRLAWAITIHKSQGMSLDAAVIDLSGAFEYGQGYVALSRVRTLAGLYLTGLNDMALEVHPDILKIDREFRASSDEAGEAFARLSDEDRHAMHANFLHAIGGKTGKKKTKSYDVKTLRKTAAKAYAKWTPEDDELLRGMWNGGEYTEDSLAEYFGRKRGAIRARLQKFGLIE